MTERIASAVAADSHCASVECAVPAADAFAFLADGSTLGRWALGAWDTVPVGEGVFRGHSLFDDRPSWVRPVADAARLCIDFHVGGNPSALTPRIVARVEPLAPPAAGEARCRIRLEAAREPDMDDARWLRLVRCHEVEVLLIQSRLALQRARSDA